MTIRSTNLDNDPITELINFGSKDVQAIQNAAVKLRPYIPSIIDTLQQNLSQHFELTTDVQLGKEPLRRYLGRIMTGPYDKRFFDYLDWVATQQPDTDYVYINTMLGQLEATLIQKILSLNLIDRSIEETIINAFSKLLWMQNHYFVKNYSSGTPSKKRNDSSGRGSIIGFIRGVPAFLRDCPMFPVVVGAAVGGTAVYMTMKKR